MDGRKGPVFFGWPLRLWDLNQTTPPSDPLTPKMPRSESGHRRERHNPLFHHGLWAVAETMRRDGFQLL